MEHRARLAAALVEIDDHLQHGIIPFWLRNGIDAQHGGYLTCFDADGRPLPDTRKYLVSQTRMIWGMSAFYRLNGDARLLEAARQGVDFLIRHFWDARHEGWHWQVARDGALLDDGKVVYGQSFTIYALSEYTLAVGDPRGIDYAERTFDLLQKYCADTGRGGYYENLENDWSVSSPGFHAGDRKSLDVHMHLLEAFTTLSQCSGKEIHRRKLAEVINVILERMVNPVSGCGMNQFDRDFKPIPAINIRRTWNAERAVGEAVATPTDTTSYGHNLELAWLLNRAAEVLELPVGHFKDTTHRLTDHALRYGFDREKGGVFRDGPHQGEALVRDKEWWQNAEVLVGFLDAFERLHDDRCLEAFFATWAFDKAYFINPALGEWRQLLTRDGRVIVGDIGNPWKAIYHTGRAMAECRTRIARILAT